MSGMKIIVETKDPDRLYVAGKMQPIESTYRLSDGWKLMATTLAEARAEAAEYGVEIDGVEVDH